MYVFSRTTYQRIPADSHVICCYLDPVACVELYLVTEISTSLLMACRSSYPWDNVSLVNNYSSDTDHKIDT